MKLNFLPIIASFVLAGLIGFLLGIFLPTGVANILAFVVGMLLPPIVSIFYPFVKFDY